MKHLFLLLACVVLTSPAYSQDEQLRPNLIVILCDDLGIGDPGCYNPNSKIPTPNIDRLAAEGIRLTDAHTPSSVCTPTRYGVLTGRYCWRTRLKRGVLSNGWTRALIEEDRQTLASMLKRYDYQSAAIGKWHLGWDWQSADGSEITSRHHPTQAVDYIRPVLRGPGEVGFDHHDLIPASLDMPPYLWLVDGNALQAPTEHTPGSKRRWSGGGGMWRAGPIAPGFDFYDVLPASTEAAVAFIERHAREERNIRNRQVGELETNRPFFLYLPLPAPHTPWVPAPEFQGDTEAGWYGDFVAQTDWSLGRILSALDRHGIADNTIIVFTSDNGSHWPSDMIERFSHDANLGYRGQKADIWEAGHRVPLIIRWPDQVQAGGVSDRLVCLTDLYRTVADIVGHELDENEAEDSMSFLDLLIDHRTNARREDIIHHSLNGTFAIRRGMWKLIPDQLGSGGFTQPRSNIPREGDPGGQLYHLGEDPQEKQNLWRQHPDVVAELSERLEQYKLSGRSR